MEFFSGLMEVFGITVLPAASIASTSAVPDSGRVTKSSVFAGFGNRIEAATDKGSSIVTL